MRYDIISTDAEDEDEFVLVAVEVKDSEYRRIWSDGSIGQWWNCGLVIVEDGLLTIYKPSGRKLTLKLATQATILDGF